MELVSKQQQSKFILLKLAKPICQINVYSISFQPLFNTIYSLVKKIQYHGLFH